MAIDVDVSFYGRLADLAGRRRTVSVAPSATARDVADALAATAPAVGEAVRAPGTFVAVGERIADLDAPLGDARSVSFGSPVSGGR